MHFEAVEFQVTFDVFDSRLALSTDCL